MPETSDALTLTDKRDLKLILFGGAFDPPHNGHLLMAQVATQELNPHKLLWIPTAHPAHRDHAQASFEQRCKMINSIIADEPTWELCRIEDSSHEISYFYHTLNQLIEKEETEKVYVLIGQDQLDNFTQWDQWQQITEQATLVVMPRKGCHSTSLPGKGKNNVLMLNTDEIDTCSTQIKQSGSSLGLPETVRDFITENQLYTATQN